LVGSIFILLITNEIDRKAIIKKDNKTIPKDLKLDFKFKISFVEMIRPAKIQNWVRKIIGIIKSGVTAKNLNKPGAWAKPTAVRTFLNDICDEWSEEDESVSQNLILTGFKICKSCRVSKTIFPI